MDPVEVPSPTTKLSYAAIGDIPFGRFCEPVGAEEKCAIFGGSVDLADGTVAWSPEAEVSVALEAGIGGANCNKITIGAAHTTGVAASENITEVDLSAEEVINLLVKSSIALAAGDYQIGVSETADLGGSPVLMDLPAMVADKWYYLSIPYSGVAADRNAVVSLGLNVAVDKGASVVRIQHVRAGSQFYDTLGIADEDVAKEDDKAEKYDPVSVLASGLMRGQLASGVTCVAMQPVFPIPGTGELDIIEVEMVGRQARAAYPQQTAGGTVIIALPL